VGGFGGLPRDGYIIDGRGLWNLLDRGPGSGRDPGLLFPATGYNLWHCVKVARRPQRETFIPFRGQDRGWYRRYVGSAREVWPGGVVRAGGDCRTARTKATVARRI